MRMGVPFDGGIYVERVSIDVVKHRRVEKAVTTHWVAANLKA